MPEFLEALTTKPEFFASHAKWLDFEPGQLIVNPGEHYQYFFILTSGAAEMGPAGCANALQTRAPQGAAMALESFLTGHATHTQYRATGAVQALHVDDRAWSLFEAAEPGEAARLRDAAHLRRRHPAAGAPGGVEIVVCRTPEMLLLAQRLRYLIYCEELGRASPHADAERRILADALDSFGYVFIALERNEPIGTLRVNLAAEGPIGALERLYGMAASPHHPASTAVCTKFVVARSHRSGSAAFRLLAAALACGFRERIAECYIDATPELLPFYKAMGFRVAGAVFDHPENGPSWPMMLALDANVRRLLRFLTAQAGNERSDA